MNPSRSQYPAYIQLRNHFHQTKTHLQVTDLNLNHPLIPDIFPIFIKRAAKKLRSIPTKLKRLTLDIRFNENSALPLYNHLLKNLQHVEHLKITLYAADAPQIPSYFEILLKVLKKLRKLQVFEIIIARYWRYHPKISMQSLIGTLTKSSQKLRDVKIIYEEGYNDVLDDGRFKPLLNFWRIQRLKTLHNLTLHLPNDFITFKSENEGRLDLSSLSKLRKLKFLDIGMVLSSDFKNFFLEPSSKTRLLPNLKCLKWSIVDDCWAKIGGISTYREYDFVVELYQKFLRSRWTAIEGFHFLGSQLARWLEIPPENFTFKFKQSGSLNDSDLKRLNQSLSTLKTDLNQLHLECQKLDNESRNGLISLLKSPKLRRLNVLCLKDLNGDDRFLLKLGEALSPELRFLKLGFKFVEQEKKDFNGQGITDEGVIDIGRGMAENCQSLESVWLEFGKYEEISDNGRESLFESFSKIKSLKSIWLNFRECGKIIEKTLKEKLREQRKGKITFL